MNISNKYLEQVKNKVLELSKDFDCEIFLFGSRAKGNHTRTSDIDIGFDHMDKKSFLTVRRQFYDFWEESPIPYQVDLVLFPETHKEFQELAVKGKVIWKER